MSIRIAELGIPELGATVHKEPAVLGRNAASRYRYCFGDGKNEGHTKPRGFNIIKFADASFGLGRSADAYVSMLTSAGYDLSIYELSFSDAFGVKVQDWPAPNFDITIVFVNPDHFKNAVSSVPSADLIDHRIVACWFWELEDIPMDWRSIMGDVDAIMVASRFVEDAFQRAGTVPVFRVPIPIQASERSLREHPKDSNFKLLTSFDFFSGFERKNPLASIAAFQRAFPQSGDMQASLVIKTSNAAYFPKKFSELVNVTSQDPRITVVDGTMSSVDIESLQDSANAFISLHRSEGFGLALAEMIARGKPVIATGWSGNLEFMESETSYLVDYTLIDVAKGEYPHCQGARWAEPDIDHAAQLLRLVAAEPRLAARNAEAASKFLYERLSLQSCEERFARAISGVSPATMVEKL